jgi:sucrose phosphorylase
MLSLAGVPGIYVHSLFGSRNCQSCVAETGRSRSINREKFQLAALEAELADPNSLKHRVFAGMKRLLQIRREQLEFHPNAQQRVLSVGKGIFALVRGGHFLVMVNVTPQQQEIDLKLSEDGLPVSETWRDLIGGHNYPVSGGKIRLRFEPYQSLWLRSCGQRKS